MKYYRCLNHLIMDERIKARYIDLCLSANRYFVDDNMELAGRGRVPPLARTIDNLPIIHYLCEKVTL